MFWDLQTAHTRGNLQFQDGAQISTENLKGSHCEPTYRRKLAEGCIVLGQWDSSVLAGLCSLIEQLSHTHSRRACVMNGASARVVQGLVPRCTALSQPQPSPTGRMVGKRVSCVENNCSWIGCCRRGALQEARLAKVRERPTRDLEHKTKKPRKMLGPVRAQPPRRALAASSLGLWGFTLTLLRSL